MRGSASRDTMKANVFDTRHLLAEPLRQAAVNAGIPTVIASGRTAGPMLRAAAGKPAGTYFPPQAVS